MDFKDFENVESYLKHTFSNKSLKKLRRNFKRLEGQPSVHFKVFFDNIKKNDFDFIMSALKDMIIKRFAKKGVQHEALKRWNLYLISAYNMINAGNASLFVYYDKEKPIAIGLNYHDGENFFSAITSFDINYNDYSLGKLMFVKRISWCFENNHHRMDLGWGNLYYKSKLANEVYKYRTEVVYTARMPLAGFAAWAIGYLLMWKYQLFNRYK